MPTYRFTYYDSHTVTVEATEERMREVNKEIVASINGEYPGGAEFGEEFVGFGGIKSVKKVKPRVKVVETLMAMAEDLRDVRPE